MGIFYDSSENELKGFNIMVTIIVIVGLLMFILPQYSVWSKELAGKAELKEAEWSRQIAVAEAEAEKESAVLKSDAEVLRAIGIAEVICVPTEANLPILEARG